MDQSRGCCIHFSHVLNKINIACFCSSFIQSYSGLGIQTYLWVYFLSHYIWEFSVCLFFYLHPLFDFLNYLNAYILSKISFFIWFKSLSWTSVRPSSKEVQKLEQTSTEHIPFKTYSYEAEYCVWYHAGCTYGHIRTHTHTHTYTDTGWYWWEKSKKFISVSQILDITVHCEV